MRNVPTTNLYCNLERNVRGKTRSSDHTPIKRMASLLGGGPMGKGGITLGMGDSISMRKTWAVSGLLSNGRVGSTDGEIRSTTWVSFSKGRMGSTDGNRSTAWVSLSNRRVESTKDGIGLTTLSTGPTMDKTI